MKTPNQLSEPEISRICENWPGSALNAAREIEAAVNAKWTEMLGAVEPVGYVDADDIKHREDMFCTVTPSKIRKQPIYTHPMPTAEPVNKEPLAIEDLCELLTLIDPETRRLPPGFLKFARAIEQAHGIGVEKENGK